MKKKAILIFGVLIFLIGNVRADCVEGITAGNNISQYGITWFFDKPYQCGTFVNGDYWVKTDDSTGVVNVIRITPDFQQFNFNSYLKWINGWEVNPTYSNKHGFDERAQLYDAILVPSLPYNAHADESLIKADSWEEAGFTTGYRRCEGGDTPTCLYAVSVLTVVGAIPENNGETVFRPSYFGANKVYYSSNNLRTDLLPSLNPVTNAPTLQWAVNRFKPVQLDYIAVADLADYLHPRMSWPNYYPASMARDVGNGVLRLMLNDSVSAKMPAVIAMTQAGIDYYGIFKGGISWSPGAGEAIGRKMPIIFASVMLDNAEMKNAVRPSRSGILDDKGLGFTAFGEDQPYQGKNTVLWGDPLGSAKYCPDEDFYWEDIIADSTRTCRDPYGYIDGGRIPGGGYQLCCTSDAWLGETLALCLMPSLRDPWNVTYYQYLLDYTARWKDSGAYTQPDPCAPVEGVCVGGTRNGQKCTTAWFVSAEWAGTTDTFCTGGGICQLSLDKFKVTYGPDPNKPGDCIMDNDTSDGIGRFPLLHEKNQGIWTGYSSEFAHSMWAKYKNCSNGVMDGTETGKDCGGICPEECVTPVQGNCEIKKAYWRIL